MNDFRSDVLEGAKAAARLHRDADVERRFVGRSSGIDVYGVASTLDVPIMFKPLAGLLGAYVRNPTPGILVTTERPAAVQRFTASHEIGHFFMAHEKSFDGEDDVGTPLKNAPSMEIQANAFAAEFLMPRWLITQVAEALFKAGLRIPDPVAVYQLALRLGTSYEATVRTLYSHGLIRRDHEADLLTASVKSIKQRILGNVPLSSWHPNVWLLTKEDDKALIETSEKDVVVLTVREASTSGVVSRLRQSGLEESVVLSEIVEPARPGLSEPLVGGPSVFSAVVQTNGASHGSVEIEQGLAWQGSFSPAMAVEVDVSAPEKGRSRKQRESRLKEFLSS